MSQTLSIGVLALQGNVLEHVEVLEESGARAVAVKTASDLHDVQGLIIPGGESTTVMKLIDRFALRKPIVERVKSGMPLWGTCMGLIVAAHDVVGAPDQPTLDLLDVSVRRNAFGRQIASAQVDLEIPVLGPDPFPAIFIRAPWIERTGPAVHVLASVNGHGVLVRQQNMLGSSFHPELGCDRRLHAYFLAMVAEHAAIGKRSTAA